MRPTLAAVALAALVAACSEPVPTPEPVRAVRVVTVAPEAAGGTSEFAAEVRARTESRLSFRVAGKLIAREAGVGDRVRPGQVLARLDAADLRLGEQAASAAVAAALAGYEQAAGDFRRFKELREKGFISGAELERRETTLKSAEALLAQARAQQGVQGNQTAYATLVAGTAGVVIGVDAEPGMVVSAGAPVLRVAYDGPRDVVFAVPEDRIGLIQALAGERDRVSVRLWGAEGAPLRASIREVAAAAEPVSRTFLVKADLGGAGATARLGQTATVLIDLPRTTEVIRLPLAALKEEQGRTIVWLVDRDSMTVRAQPVQVAGAEGNDAVVSAGLSAGDVVVTAGVHVLSPGQKVKLYVEPGTRAVAAAR